MAGVKLAVTIRQPPPRPRVTRRAAPLPKTAAQRRAERLRATALRLLPFLLFALAAVPRTWAPDLVPFGERQASALIAARVAASVPDPRQLPPWQTVLPSWDDWLASGDTDLVVSVSALLVELPAASRVVSLGLLDGAAAVVIFLTARSLLGWGPALFAGTLYAVSPWAWVITRDPAPRALPILAAVGLLVAIDVVRERRARSACWLALLCALLARVDSSGWVFVIPWLATMLLARPGGRAWLAGLVTLIALGGPSLLRAADSIRAIGSEPTETAYRFWGVVAGVGAEVEHLGGADGPSEHVRIAALAGSGILLVLGAALATRAGPRSRAALVPLLWTVLPLAALATLAPRPDIEPFTHLLPAAAVLMAQPLTGRSGGNSVLIQRLASAVGVVLVGSSAVALGVLVWRTGSAAASAGSQPFAAWTSAVEARRADREARGLEGAAAASLHFWQGVADVAAEAAEHVGTRELLVFADTGGDAGETSPAGDASRILASLLAGRLEVRPLPSGLAVLPLRDEALYVMLPGSNPPPALDRPSSRLALVPLPSVDAAARIVSLRPRPIDHWLVGMPSLPEVRFADGSALVGAHGQFGRSTTSDAVELYWTFGSSRADAPSARFAEVRARREGAEPRVTRVALPDTSLRRTDELVVQRIGVPRTAEAARSGESWSLALFSADGSRVPVVSGAADSLEGAPLLGPRP